MPHRTRNPFRRRVSDDKSYLLLQKVFHDLLANEIRSKMSSSKRTEKNEAPSNTRHRKVRKVLNTLQHFDLDTEYEDPNSTSAINDEFEEISNSRLSINESATRSRARARVRRTDSNATLTSSPPRVYPTAPEDARVYKGLCIERRSDYMLRATPILENRRQEHHSPPPTRIPKNKQIYNSEQSRSKRRTYSKESVEFADVIASKHDKLSAREAPLEKYPSKHNKQRMRKNTECMPRQQHQSKKCSEIDTKMRILAEVWEQKLMTTKKVLQGILACLEKEQNYSQELQIDKYSSDAEVAEGYATASDDQQQLSFKSVSSGDQLPANNEQPLTTQPAGSNDENDELVMAVERLIKTLQSQINTQTTTFIDKPPEGDTVLNDKPPFMSNPFSRLKPEPDTFSELPSEKKLKLYNAAIDKWDSRAQSDCSMGTRCFSLKRKFATTVLNRELNKENEPIWPQVKEQTNNKDAEESSFSCVNGDLFE